MDPRHDRPYARMARAIAYLADRWEERPDLAHAARAAGLSPWHFQREFRRWVGVSPKRFQGLLTLEHAGALLRAGAPVLDAALAAGASGPSRLHDLAVGFEAATPGEIGSGGAGLTLRHGLAESPFGRLFAAASPRGLVRLAFVEPGDEDGVLAATVRAWPRAAVVADAEMAEGIARAIFAHDARGSGRMRLAPRGTNFQVKVWQALLAVPPGAVTTYAAIARALGTPGAARAVGAACAANPIALLIPCHRVLREGGALGGYAFGGDRKRALIAWEAAALPAADAGTPQRAKPSTSPME